MLQRVPEPVSAGSVGTMAAVGINVNVWPWGKWWAFAELSKDADFIPTKQKALERAKSKGIQVWPLKDKIISSISVAGRRPQDAGLHTYVMWLARVVAVCAVHALAREATVSNAD